MLRLNRVLILKFSAFLVVSMSVLLGALSLLSNSSVIWFGAGMLVATLYWLIMEVVPGVEYRRLRDAASAEAFTSAELKRLRSVGWTFVDCVEFHGFDVDHVAIGPGGVVAIET